MCIPQLDLNETYFLTEFCHFYTLLAKSRVEPQSKKVSMLILSKEAFNKDENFKLQMMLSMKDDKSESQTELVWKDNGFFGDQRTDITMVKANFTENPLVYVNNGSITSVKGGHAMYLDFVILAQILSVANPPPGLD